METSVEEEEKGIFSWKKWKLGRKMELFNGRIEWMMSGREYYNGKFGENVCVVEYFNDKWWGVEGGNELCKGRVGGGIVF